MSAIVLIDTCVVIHLLSPEPSGKDEARTWQNVRDSIVRLEKNGARILLPAVVLAELASSPHGQGIVEAAQSVLPAFEVVAFDAEAATITGDFMRSRWANRSGSRPCLKFDSMIAATAIRRKATQLLTTNGRDFSGVLAGSGVQVVDAGEAHGQVSIIGVR